MAALREIFVGDSPNPFAKKATVATPYEASLIMQPGDDIIIRPGTYRDMVYLRSKLCLPTQDLPVRFLGDGPVIFRGDVADKAPLASNPIATTNSSTTVVITQTNHNFSTGHTVTISGVASTLNNIPAAELNGAHKITKLTANTYSFTTTTSANATGSGGGSAVFARHTLPFGFRIVDGMQYVNIEGITFQGFDSAGISTNEADDGEGDPASHIGIRNCEFIFNYEPLNDLTDNRPKSSGVFLAAADSIFEYNLSKWATEHGIYPVGDRITIRGNNFLENSGCGIRGEGNDIWIVDNLFKDNGQHGLIVLAQGSYTAKNWLIEKNKFISNVNRQITIDDNAGANIPEDIFIRQNYFDGRNSGYNIRAYNGSTASKVAYRKTDLTEPINPYGKLEAANFTAAAGANNYERFASTNANVFPTLI